MRGKPDAGLIAQNQRDWPQAEVSGRPLFWL